RDAIDDEFITAPDYRHAWIHPESVEVGHDEVIAGPVLKLLARVPGMSSSDMASAVIKRVEHLAQVTFSTENGLIEFAPPGVTKAAALTRVAEQVGALRFRREPGAAPRTVAFGDMPNDVEMLQWADLGVAMGNAHPIAAAAADETTLTSDEAGLEPVLSRWF
ncbi:MAG TPA: Cof-type HAD-IIB family hydrolase, partial [Dietzia timorensis]